MAGDANANRCFASRAARCRPGWGSDRAEIERENKVSAQNDDGAAGANDWPVALVAIVIVAVLGAVAVAGIIRYDPGQTPPLWAGVIAVLGVALGAVGALLFIRLGVRTVRDEAAQVLRAAIQDPRPDRATWPTPPAADTLDSPVNPRRPQARPEAQPAIVPEVVGNGRLPNAGDGRSGAVHLAVLQTPPPVGAGIERISAPGRIVPLAARRVPLSPG
jgi:hypothetical protein